MNSSQLKLQAKKAYELGRLKAAFKFLWVIVPVVVLSACTCGEVGLPLIVGCVLGLTVVALKWRGEEYGFSVGPGLLAGVVAFSIPLVMHLLGICCRTNLEIVFCAISGILGGIIVGRVVGKSNRKHRITSLLVGLLIAGITAVLGCISFEIGALMGLFAALAVAAFFTFSLGSQKTTS